MQTRYSGNQVTLTDEAGKVRVNTLDAMGRLTNVQEDPNGFNYHERYVNHTPASAVPTREHRMGV